MSDCWQRKINLELTFWPDSSTIDRNMMLNAPLLLAAIDFSIERRYVLRMGKLIYKYQNIIAVPIDYTINCLIDQNKNYKLTLLIEVCFFLFLFLLIRLKRSLKFMIIISRYRSALHRFCSLCGWDCGFSLALADGIINWLQWESQWRWKKNVSMVTTTILQRRKQLGKKTHTQQNWIKYIQQVVIKRK